MNERVIKGYHAHIYYDPARTRDAAARVRQGLTAFNVQLGLSRVASRSIRGPYRV